MALRVTGLASGLDTESIIAELVSANSYKVSSLQKEQTALSWKQEAWKTLNNKVYSFYTDTLSDLRFLAAYSTKKTTVSDSTYASVTAASTASNSVQYMSVEKLAKSGYLTGGLIGGGMGDFTKNSTLSEIDSSLAGGSGTLKLSIGGGEAVDINITGETTMEDIVNQIKETGLNANFDEANQRLFISSAKTGEAFDFTIEAGEGIGANVMSALKIDTTDASSGANKIEGQDAQITLNGAVFTSSTNTFTVNDLTITALQESDGKEVSLTTDVDSDGMYNTIKNFVTKYNELMTEMSTLLSADSAAGYKPLTSEEKSAMTESEIDEWEKKIKDALFRKDDTLSTVVSSMSQVMSESVSMKDGSIKYLFDFGIGTGSYFNTDDKTRNNFHIDGDKEDSTTKNNDDKLMVAIKDDPNAVSSFFQNLTKNLYNKITDLMSGTKEYSSAYTLYNDKQMKTEYTDYTTRIAEAEKKLNEKMDKYYAKFSAMETAMAQLQSKQSSISGLLG